MKYCWSNEDFKSCKFGPPTSTIISCVVKAMAYNAIQFYYKNSGFLNIFYYPGSEKSSKLETLVITEFHCKYYYNITSRTWACQKCHFDVDNEVFECCTGFVIWCDCIFVSISTLKAFCHFFL